VVFLFFSHGNNRATPHSASFTRQFFRNYTVLRHATPCNSAHIYVPTFLEQPAASILRVNVLIYICLWTRDRPVSHNTQETDIHATIGIRSCNPNKPEVADPRLRARCHWNRLFATLHGVKCASGSRETCLHLRGTRGGDYSPNDTA